MENPLLVDFMAKKGDSIAPRNTVVMEHFNNIRANGTSYKSAMFVAARYDLQRGYVQMFGISHPQKSLVKMIVNAAKSSVQSLLAWMISANQTDIMSEV